MIEELLYQSAPVHVDRLAHQQDTERAQRNQESLLRWYTAHFSSTVGRILADEHRRKIGKVAHHHPHSVDTQAGAL